MVRTTLDKFGLTFIKTLHGGSESYLALTQRTDGARFVVKVMMPNDHGMTAELAALQAAKGRGYVELIDANPEQDVLIIEELGTPIASSALTTQQQLQHITHALQLAGRQKSSLQRWFTVQRKPIGSTTISNTRRLG